MAIVGVEIMKRKMKFHWKTALPFYLLGSGAGLIATVTTQHIIRYGNDTITLAEGLGYGAIIIFMSIILFYHLNGKLSHNSTKKNELRA